MAEKETLDQAWDKHMAVVSVNEGDLVKGTVVQVDKEYAYLDVGLKSEGKIPLAEFAQTPSAGDSVEVVLLNKEGKNGEVLISKRKADHKSLMKKFEAAFADKEPVAGKIVKAIKGGFEVDLGFGLKAFLPISKVDVARVENPEHYVGLEGRFIIDRLGEKGKTNIVVTRRELLISENEQARENFFATAQVGDEVEGTVKSFTSFGAFVDLGGFDGLLHLNDMSWGHATRPKDYVKKDEKLKLKVARLDAEHKRINLSLKHFEEDPWVGFEERYRVNDVVEGTVTKLADFGAFVELERGIEGLVHISELSWVKRIKHPKEALQIGDRVKVMILGYDTEAERISLGLKQAMPNPWNDIAEKYPVGSKLKRTIKKVTNSGAFVELEEGIEGFLHMDDVSWTKRARNAQALLKPNEEIEVVVLENLPEERRIRLGVKQLSADPWTELRGYYTRGEALEGIVSGKTDFGVFVKVPVGDLEGLIHKNNLSEDRNADVDALLSEIKEGDKITATIVEIIPEKKRLALSVRDFKIKQQRQEINKYMKSDDENEGSTLGDFFKTEK